MNALNSTWTKRIVGSALLAAAPLFVGIAALPQVSAQVGISIERGHGHGGSHSGGHGGGGGHGSDHSAGHASSGGVNSGGAHSPGHHTGKDGASTRSPGSRGDKGSLNNDNAVVLAHP